MIAKRISQRGRRLYAGDPLKGDYSRVLCGAFGEIDVERARAAADKAANCWKFRIWYRCRRGAQRVGARSEFDPRRTDAKVTGCDIKTIGSGFGQKRPTLKTWGVFFLVRLKIERIVSHCGQLRPEPGTAIAPLCDMLAIRIQFVELNRISTVKMNTTLIRHVFFIVYSCFFARITCRDRPGTTSLHGASGVLTGSPRYLALGTESLDLATILHETEKHLLHHKEFL